MKQNIGKRVALHPALDRWMQGDRYGEIIGIGNARLYHDTFTGERSRSRPYRVKLDKSEDIIRLHQTSVTIID